MAERDVLDASTVAVQDVTVRYRTPSDVVETRGGNRLLRGARTVLGKQPQVVVRALSGISFVASAGEQVGVVGQNGSGKSTLLRVIAGLEKPAKGRVLAESTPVLIGVNAALQQALSGAQNVRLGCLAMGLTRAETDAAFPEVLDLAQLGPAIHRPMQTYSSGMASRLRFAIATAANPHILLIDEALATGDAAFRERSEARMEKLRANAGTVFLVSHAAKTIEETCTRAIWLNHGRLVLDGAADDVALRYRKFAWALAKGRPARAKQIIDAALAEREDTTVHVKPPARHDPRPRHARPHHVAKRPRTPSRSEPRPPIDRPADPPSAPQQAAESHR